MPTAVPHDTAPKWAAVHRAGRDRALVAFLCVEVLAFPALLWLGRNRWFAYDDWDFLANRQADHFRDLMRPHGVHWSTLPILLYRAVWSVFGLHSYVPYQVWSVFGHLVVAFLVLLVMRRAGVRPWTATAAATILVFLGSGYDNIVWAFQIGFDASLAFGLAHLLLADHDGRFDRRDAWGLAAGFAGLLCSGAAVTMAVVVGLAVLVRRGWRLAALHTAPLALAYLGWYYAYARDNFATQERSSASEIVRFTRVGTRAALDGVAQIPRSGWLLGVLVLAGVALWLSSLDRMTRRRRAAAPVALLAGSVVFLVVSGWGRASTFGAELGGSQRYVHVVVVLMMPVVALAADEVMRRWPPMTVAVAALLVVSLVGNVRDFDDGDRLNEAVWQDAIHDYFVALPYLPVADDLPATLRPSFELAPWVTMGWLRAEAAAGRVPDPRPLDPTFVATTELGLVLRLQRVDPSGCVTQRLPVTLRLAAGDALRLSGPLAVTYTNELGARSRTVTFQPTPPLAYVVAQAGPLDLSLDALETPAPPALCRNAER